MAHLIWNELTQLVKDKTGPKAKPSIPLTRFLEMGFKYIMAKASTILRREGSIHYVAPKMIIVRHDVGDMQIRAAPIPEAFLALADQESPAVLTYRQTLVPMENPQPDAPAPGAPPPQPRLPLLPPPPRLNLSTQICIPLPYPPSPFSPRPIFPSPPPPNSPPPPPHLHHLVPHPQSWRPVLTYP